MRFHGLTAASAALFLAFALRCAASQAGDAESCFVPIQEQAGAFHFDQLANLVDQKKVRSIRQLVPLLPQEYKDHWTAVYDSDSAQEGQTFPDRPRAISFGKTGELILAYTQCKPKERKLSYHPCNTLETLEFDRATVRFILREVPFPAKAGSKPKENPSQCLQCHGNPPRPIWPAYSTWGGAYGSIDASRKEVMVIGSPEDQGYQSFIRNVKSKPKDFVEYSALTWNWKRAEKAKLPAGLRPILHSALDRPNIELAFLLGRMNGYKNLRRLLDHPSYSKFKYALAGAMKGCPNMDAFYPAAIRDKAGPIAELRSSMQSRLAKEFEATKKRIKQNNYDQALFQSDQVTGFVEPALPESLVGVNYLLRAQGEQMRDWSLSFDEKLNFQDGNQGWSFLENIYQEYAAKCDPGMPKDCDSLQRKSVETLSSDLSRQETESSCLPTESSVIDEKQRKALEDASGAD